MKATNRPSFRHPTNLRKHPLIIKASEHFYNSFGLPATLEPYAFFLQLLEQMLMRRRDYLQINEIDEVSEEILKHVELKAKEERKERINWLIFNSGLFTVDTDSGFFKAEWIVFDL
jgi:hypothetical protein